MGKHCLSNKNDRALRLVREEPHEYGSVQGVLGATSLVKSSAACGSINTHRAPEAIIDGCPPMPR